MKTTKEQEIQALKALVAMNGYFADFFKGDLDRMVDNIAKDFPIELETGFNHAAECMREQLESAKRAHNAEMLEMADAMLTAPAHGTLEQAEKALYACVASKLGALATIRRKRAHGLKVSTEEVGSLLKIIANLEKEKEVKP
jgi:tellurite resistance protein